MGYSSSSTERSIPSSSIVTLNNSSNNINIVSEHNSGKMTSTAAPTRLHRESKSNDKDDDDTTVESVMTTSHNNSPLLVSSSQPFQQQQLSMIEMPEHMLSTSRHVPGTPSTVSSVPTFPDSPLHGHHRLSSWDSVPHYVEQHGLPPSQHHSTSAWNNNSHQRVASFRNEQHGSTRYGFPPMAPAANNSVHTSQWQHPHQVPFLPASHSRVSSIGQQQQQQQSQHQHMDARSSSMVRQGYSAAVQSQQQQQQQQQQHHHHQQRRMYAMPPSPSSSGNNSHGHANTSTSVPAALNRPSVPPSSPGASRQGSSSANVLQGSGGSRSASEVLKTLLRKKACLYEADTSRAVALATWLVGRELAMEFGFFSRQQLQAGVHACVADKITSGTITRTKVNRCMQIILNSCFHYIIPRPDGTEENGDLFRGSFAITMQDDSDLLHELPAPWNDLTVDKDVILQAIQDEMAPKKPRKVGNNSSGYSTPQSSPRVGSMNADKSPGRDSNDGDEGKKAVLLCFNENVRCADDVYRSHNEFIRDTAHASHLQLSTQEWLQFFGSESSTATNTVDETAGLWNNIGVPIPNVDGQSQPDALGAISNAELGKFRTTWCTKRYEHEHDLCGFAHVEINNGWLRRDPNVHTYRAVMCPHVHSVTSARFGSRVFTINSCPNGVGCEYAHSQEEIHYHPQMYKKTVCSSTSRAVGCNLGDVCPNYHPIDAYRFPRKSDKGAGRRSHHHHNHQHSHSHTAASGGKHTLLVLPTGSPTLYTSPAPKSSFEEQLSMPGLQDLYRRQCSVVYAHLRTSNRCNCSYSYFGDDDGVNGMTSSTTATFNRGLPTPITKA